MEPVYIIGAGAIGKVLAVCLVNDGKKVVLLRGSVDHGETHRENIRVTLSSQESAMAQALLQSQGRLVSREELERTLWPDGVPTARALDDLVYRLRRKVKPLQLSIFSARQRGFVLGVAIEVTPSAPLTESGISDD